MLYNKLIIKNIFHIDLINKYTPNKSHNTIYDIINDELQWNNVGTAGNCQLDDARYDFHAYCMQEYISRYEELKKGLIF